MNRLCFGSMTSAVALSVAVMAGCPASGRDCNAVGCAPSGYQLGNEAWPAGDYEVAITYERGERVEVSCAFRIDAAFAGGEEDDAGVEYEPPMAECSQTTGGKVSLSFAQRATFTMFDSPASFELSVKREGRVLFEETITPDYDASEINGPGCGVCRTANETIDVGDLR